MEEFDKQEVAVVYPRLCGLIAYYRRNGLRSDWERQWLEVGRSLRPLREYSEQDLGFLRGWLGTGVELCNRYNIQGVDNE